MTGLSRRDFVVVIAEAGGGLLLGCRVSEPRRAGSGPTASSTQAPTPPAFAPNAFVRVGTDDTVTVMLPQAEMGQGIYTALSMLVAEELEVGLDQVKVEPAPGDNRVYANPLIGFQATGGSTSVRAFYEPMRQAGAAARTMLVAAAAQRWGVSPSACRAKNGAVRHTENGRSLTYGQLAEEAARQPVPAKVTLKDPKQFTLIGTPAKRLDTRSKVDGTAQFGIDVRLPGMKIATIAASPVWGGKLAGVDQDKAMAIKGVRQVVWLDDVVAVVADHMFAARQGLAALAPRWDDGKNANLTVADVVKDLEAASRKPGVIARKEGNALSGIGPAARNLEAVYQVPFLAHAAMEPLSCTVHVRKDGCDVWCGSQVQGRARETAAEVTGLPLEKVVLHNYLLGGGFGRRLEHDYVTQAVRIAKEVDGPVKIVWTREEDMQHDAYRPYYYDRLSAGLDQRGKLVRWTHRVVGPSLLARWAPPAFKDGLDGDAVDGAVQLVYDIPAIQIEYVRQEEPLYTGWWRGVGVTHNTFVVESFIDELAAASKQDPVAFRRSLLGKSPRARAVLDLATKEAGWGKPLPQGQGRGVALMYSGWDTYVAQVAEVELTGGEIRVRRVVCAVDCGTMVNPDTVRAQTESGIIFGLSGALWGEVTFKNGRVEQSNFTDYRVLRMNEAPTIEVHLVRNSEAPGGMGEPGAATIAPAVSNALFAVTGKRIRQLPLQKALRA
ncbi:MAG TPA: xanthine dehydrogenase family protein molybdopterin-binding subunit [Gemmatimonadales bacterium]|jgi:isoquinoline 1-oxidoreductase beta subunit